ncbi:MAG: carboxypeptidase regulatory-like domain-containing protein [Candidatus Muiribacteriota bacterium]
MKLFKLKITIFLLFISVISAFSNPSGNFRGHIMNRQNRYPVKDAYVEIGGKILYTDSNGFFDFKNLVTGNLIIKIAHNEYKDYVDLVKIEHGTNSQNFYIEPKPKMVRIRGMIENQDTGLGVSNINVSLDNIMTQTDSYGQFIIEGIIPGKYIAKVQDADYERLLEEITVTDSDVNNIKFFVKPLIRYGKVFGEIRDDRGTLIENAQVTIGNNQSINVTGGKFVAEEIVRGKYRMVVYSDGYEPYEEYINIDEVSQIRIRLAKDEKQQVAALRNNNRTSSTNQSGVAVGTKGSLEGFVRDADNFEYLSGVTLSIGDRYTVSGSDGMYYFHNLNPGDYTLNIISKEYGIYAADIKIQPGNGVFNISLKKSFREALIYGKVIDKKTQKPVIGATVTLDGKPVKTDIRGFYQFKVEKDQYYEVKVVIGRIDFYRDITHVTSDRQQKDIFLEVE